MMTKLQKTPEKRKAITKEEALATLKEHAPPLFRAYYEAFDKFKEEILQTTVLRSRLEPTLLHVKIADAVANAFPDKWRKGGYSRFVLRLDGLQIIFKLLNKQYCPKYVPTSLSGKILRQIPVELFKGDENAKLEPILIFGYLKSRLGEYTSPCIVYFDETAKWVIGAEDFMIQRPALFGDEVEQITVRVKRKAEREAE